MKKHMVNAIFLSAGMLLASAASAVQKFDYVDVKSSGININDGRIHVNPLNGDYGQPTAQTVSYHVEMKAGCKNNTYLKTAFAAFGQEYVSGGILESSQNYRVSAAANLEKTLPWKELVLNVPLNKLGVDPVKVCKDYVKTAKQQGASLQQIFAKDHTITKPVVISAVAGCGVYGKNGDQYGMKDMFAQLQIICKAGSVAGINDIKMNKPKPSDGPGSVQANFHITGAAFQASPKLVTGTCPTNVNFTGSISASGKGSVQYRVNFPGSAKTNVRTLNFTQAGSLPLSNIVFNATHAYPTATATLEIVSPTVKKVFAKFEVQCVVANGPNDVKQNAAPKMKLQVQTPASGR